MTSSDGLSVRAFISLGSNIRPRRNIARAIDLLSARLEVLAISSLYASSAKGAPQAPSFLNAAVEALVDVSPSVLKFEVLRPIESEIGRRRTDDPNAPRPIDLDLSLYGALVLNHPEEGLVLPDPGILTSAHVIVPLAEIAGDFIHPANGLALAALAADVDPGDLRIDADSPVGDPPTRSESD